MSVNSSGTIQVRPIWPVQGSPQACTDEPCRNQPRWKGLAAIGPLLGLRVCGRVPGWRNLDAIDVPGVARFSVFRRVGALRSTAALVGRVPPAWATNAITALGPSPL